MGLGGAVWVVDGNEGEGLWEMKALSLWLVGPSRVWGKEVN
jgi:hypothetical protein